MNYSDLTQRIALPQQFLVSPYLSAGYPLIFDPSTEQHRIASTAAIAPVCSFVTLDRGGGGSSRVTPEAKTSPFHRGCDDWSEKDHCGRQAAMKGAEETPHIARDTSSIHRSDPHTLSLGDI